MIHQRLYAGVGIFLLLCGSVQAQQFSVNEKGTRLCEVVNKACPDRVLGVEGGVRMVAMDEPLLWRKTNLDDGSFFLDGVGQPDLAARLLATSYMPARMTRTGLEGRGRDVRWREVPAEDGWVLLRHEASGRYLSRAESGIVLVEEPGADDATRWKLQLKTFDLSAIESPILLMGDDQTGFRDPALVYADGVFHMYYSLVLTEEDEKIYWYVAHSKSEDLIRWTDPVIITPKGQNFNYASPGNLIRFNGEWVLCMQSYVMPGYTRRDPLRFGNKDCRLWTIRSKDLETWSEPEMLWVNGPDVEPGSMIDAYLLEDKDEPGKWWCFYKNKGFKISCSYSCDLKTWTYGWDLRPRRGENVCVWVENDEYYMLHSPEQGMGIMKSDDLKTWEHFLEEEVLGQANWQYWAGQRVTAGFIMDLRDDPAVGKYLMFFHGQGPAPKTTEIINSGTDIGIAWSDDLLNWKWPGQ